MDFEGGRLGLGVTQMGLMGINGVNDTDSDSLYLSVSILVSPMLGKNISNIHFIFLGCKV